MAKQSEPRRDRSEERTTKKWERKERMAERTERKTSTYKMTENDRIHRECINESITHYVM